MQMAGLSASLGAFIAGVLLANSDYRHEIEADIAPFEGLLLGLFFTAIGMSLNLALIVERPHLVIAIVVGLLAVKAGVLFLLGRRAGLEAGPSRRLALSIAQGGGSGSSSSRPAFPSACSRSLLPISSLSR